MKVDIMEIQENDIIMVCHNIGNTPVNEVDEYCKTLSEHLDDIFGKNHTVLIPLREGKAWEFTIIRKIKEPKNV